jgi:hypothetical protein
MTARKAGATEKQIPNGNDRKKARATATANTGVSPLRIMMMA